MVCVVGRMRDLILQLSKSSIYSTKPYAGWVSLFTLHALWPLLWIWATLWREDRGWGMRHIADDQQALHQRLETVVQQLEQVQREVDVLKAKEAK